MQLPPSPAQRAEAGALHLDQVRPGWAEEINERELDQSSRTCCVIAQLEETFLDYEDLGIRESDMARLGFIRDGASISPEGEYELLTQAWIAEVRRRLPSRQANLLGLVSQLLSSH
jgi:hypothetical protein